MTAKRYKEIAARSRVPLGFLLLVVFLVTARPTWPRLIAGGLIAFSGVVLRAWAAGHLAKNRELSTGGPFAYMRNPLYVGTALTSAGFALIGGVWWIALLFAVVLGVVYLPVVYEEESYLREIFPGYAEYAARVPRFWPRFGGPSGAARFRMSLWVRNQEYNALIAYLCVLALLIWKLVG